MAQFKFAQKTNLRSLFELTNLCPACLSLSTNDCNLRAAGRLQQFVGQVFCATMKLAPFSVNIDLDFDTDVSFSELDIINHHTTNIEKVIGGKKSSREVGEILIVIFTPSSYSYSRSVQTRQNQEFLQQDSKLTTLYCQALVQAPNPPVTESPIK